ncbi:homocitrate synthase [Ophiocordyceps camponoti-floridani]|uniref:Homocitrate synthase n=1 Tax=Ophiocordyceps camponoti-floridani TaxID=2030778 RepID=A0A8H4Q452_9HYPO|nr:homocitrate synthase [Ophiocordyceps camponoti-floridani]
MPLHLLGKKSWNVYNADNMARVRRDEAAAAIAASEAEKRAQQVESERRLAILRGEALPPSPPDHNDHGPAFAEVARRRPEGSRMGRLRKRQGEDDTDFELRVAREHGGQRRSPHRHTQSSAPIVDSAGHTDLFGSERIRSHAHKQRDPEGESRHHGEKHHDQSKPRRSNTPSGSTKKPWYTNADADMSPSARTSEVDPRRKQRQAKRLADEDPLTFMKEGARKVRELRGRRERERRERERRERDRELGKKDGRDGRGRR